MPSSTLDETTVRLIKAEYAAFGHMLDSFVDLATLIDAERTEETGLAISSLLSNIFCDLEFLEHRGMLNQEAYDRRQAEISRLLPGEYDLAEEALESLPAPTVMGSTSIN